MNNFSLWRINPDGSRKLANRYRSLSDARTGAEWRGNGHWKITNTIGATVSEFEIVRGEVRRPTPDREAVA